jgi:hypothetical protein
MLKDVVLHFLSKSFIFLPKQVANVGIIQE